MSVATQVKTTIVLSMGESATNVVIEIGKAMIVR